MDVLIIGCPCFQFDPPHVVLSPLPARPGRPGRAARARGWLAARWLRGLRRVTSGLGGDTWHGSPARLRRGRGFQRPAPMAQINCACHRSLLLSVIHGPCAAGKLPSTGSLGVALVDQCLLLLHNRVPDFAPDVNGFQERAVAVLLPVLAALVDLSASIGLTTLILAHLAV